MHVNLLFCCTSGAIWDVGEPCGFISKYITVSAFCVENKNSLTPDYYTFPASYAHTEAKCRNS